MNTKKLIALFCAFSFVLSASGCSDSSSSEAVSDVSSSVSDAGNSSVAESVVDESANTDSESSTLNEQGEHIKKAYEFFQNTNYSFKVTLTDNNGDITNITKVVRGDDVYQLQGNSIGSGGYIKVDGKGYDFDNTCGIFKTDNDKSLPTMIESTVEENLPQTFSHISEEDTEKYDVEEYTYTGDTYITILDFCFDKETGDIVKYTATYSIEGEDDTIEVREYSEMTTEINQNVFNTSVATSLKDFDSLSEDVRLGYCQGVCATAGVSTDEMNEFGIDTDKLKTISYEDFVSLVYSYGYNGV